LDLLIFYLHIILALLLFAAYLFLAVRGFRARSRSYLPYEVTLAQLARIFLLALYFTGLVLSINMGRTVAGNHHLFSLLPAVVIFVFQMARKAGRMAAALMFGAMALSILAIAFSALF